MSARRVTRAQMHKEVAMRRAGAEILTRFKIADHVHWNSIHDQTPHMALHKGSALHKID